MCVWVWVSVWVCRWLPWKIEWNDLLISWGASFDSVPFWNMYFVGNEIIARKRYFPVMLTDYNICCVCLFFFSERRKDAIINGKGEKDEEKKKWSINSIPGKKLIIQLWYNVCQLSNEFMKYVCTHFSKIRSIGQILWLMYSFPLDSVSFFLFDFLLDKAY